MYTIRVEIEGTAPLLQHRYPMPTMEDISKGGKKQTGSIDYTEEWHEYLYVDGDGEIYQPASHIEGAMIKAAVNFKIPGKRGKTYKDLTKAAVFVRPDAIPHGVKAPSELSTDVNEPMYLDLRPVVVQRARVVRIRPAFAPGWKLQFDIEVLDEQVSSQIINEILVHAGQSIGIGDFRPRFGRFIVTHFEQES